MMAVDRATRCIVGVAVVWERSTDILQTLLDTSVWAAHYFSDAFDLYLSGIYAGTHQAVADKEPNRRAQRVDRTRKTTGSKGKIMPQLGIISVRGIGLAFISPCLMHTGIDGGQVEVESITQVVSYPHAGVMQG